MPAPVLLYDGDCAFCTTCAQLVEKRIRADADVVAWQFADLAALGVTAEQAAMLCRAGRIWRIAGGVLLLPGISWPAARVYRLVAANRHRLPGGTPACKL